MLAFFETQAKFVNVNVNEESSVDEKLTTECPPMVLTYPSPSHITVVMLAGSCPSRLSLRPAVKNGK